MLFIFVLHARDRLDAAGDDDGHLSWSRPSARCAAIAIVCKPEEQ